MSYTPVEIRHVRLRRGFFGYRRGQVDRLLDDIVISFETVWRERADNSDRVELLEGELKRYREHVLRAEQPADVMRGLTEAYSAFAERAAA